MKQDRRIELLKDIAGLIGSVADLDNLLALLVITATRVLEVRASSLLLLDKKTGRLYFHTALGDKKENVKEFELKKGEGIAGWVFERGEPLLVENVKEDPRWASEIAEKVGFNTGSIACAPLKVEGEVIGVLEVIDREDGAPLRPEDLKQLQAFSDLAAATLLSARAYKNVQREVSELRRELGSRRRIIGNSPSVRKALEDCSKVADSKATTLITGESGTGKELFARLIHDLSPRSGGPMTVVNCGALPETLLERELFGHEKGAFTGADSMKPGLFESADTGTIFLDEIAETSPAMQVKLLRVLQEGAFYRVGGSSPIRVDVRVIAATNKDLEKMVKEKTFREDLFYRLNVFRLRLPPLRDRRDDIPALAEKFLARTARDMSRPVRGFSDEAMNALMRYSWPGNIRQLENAVERAVIMSESELIELDDLPGEVRETGGGDIHVGMSLKDAQDGFKRAFIAQSLAFLGGNKTKTAKMLGIQRTYLSRLIRELGINS
ncbi:MAG: sigma-54-dependent Fis family transcriptional regulator [Candidatus Nitrospinota bacterium M3_3B_026]